MIITYIVVFISLWILWRTIGMSVRDAWAQRKVSAERQIDDSPFQIFENGEMRPMRKADYLKLDEMKRKRNIK